MLFEYVISRQATAYVIGNRKSYLPLITMDKHRVVCHVDSSCHGGIDILIV